MYKKSIRLSFFISVLVFLISIGYGLVSAEENINNMPYESFVTYQIDKPITFPDVMITYKGEEVDEGGENNKASVFDVSNGSITKQVIVPPLSMSGTLVRFGISFYRIFHKPGSKTVTVKKGIW
jgi:hypothetical protein